MDNTPKISVIIPIYNQEKYLRYCLESVLLQNLQEIEVICVNDGSTDNSFNILSELAWTDERLRIINQDNKGVGEARNVGIRAARGEFISFIDPDDEYYNFKALETLYDKANKRNALVCGGCFAKKLEGSGVQNEFSGCETRYVFRWDRFYSYREYQYDFGFHRFIYNRHFIIDNNLFFPNLKRFEDPVWFVNVLHKAKRFFGISDTVYLYRKGHKEINYNKDKVIHTITGIIDISRVAIENGYSHLLELERIRLIKDHAEIIYSYICDDDKEVTKLLHVFEDIVETNDVEKKILSTVMRKRDAKVSILQSEAEKLQNNFEKIRLENGALKRTIDMESLELKEINENLESVMKELALRKKQLIKQLGGNIIPYPYVHKSHEADGITWTDLGDGRIEANGIAQKDTKFILTPPLVKTNIKTNHLRYKLSTGAPNTSSFTWFISGSIANKEQEVIRCPFRKITINGTNEYDDSFEIDTSGYDYFCSTFIFVKAGRTLDHVIFKPEICPID